MLFDQSLFSHVFMFTQQLDGIQDEGGVREDGHFILDHAATTNHWDYVPYCTRKAWFYLAEHREARCL